MYLPEVSPLVLAESWVGLGLGIIMVFHLTLPVYSEGLNMFSNPSDRSRGNNCPLSYQGPVSLLTNRWGGQLKGTTEVIATPTSLESRRTLNPFPCFIWPPNRFFFPLKTRVPDFEGKPSPERAVLRQEADAVKFRLFVGPLSL